MAQTTKTPRPPKTDWADTVRWTVEELTSWVLTQYALSMYEHGWDVVIECTDRQDVEKLIAASKGRTRFGAVQAVKKGLALDAYNSNRREIEATAW